MMMSWLKILFRSAMQIFMDIAVLVDAQGDMLDNIETQVLIFLGKEIAFG